MKIAEHLAQFPEQPWVYLFKDKEGQIIYIGKAKNLKKRVSQYFAPGSLRKQEMLKVADSLDFLIVKSESEALYLENNLIKKHQPFYNRMLKWGNGYAYLKLTHHPFPQILTVMRKKNDKALYIGPKHHTKELKKLLQYLKMLLGYRTCPISQFKQGKLCSEYYFKLCKGRCAHCPSQDDMTKILTPEQEKEAYKHIVQQFTAFFKGDTKPIENQLKQEMEIAIQQQHFERAATLRDIFLHIAQLVEKQDVELPKEISGAFLSLKRIGNQTVFVLLKFFEGRLIDVVRDTIPDEESDFSSFSSMIAGFELELGDLQTEERGENAVIAYSKTIHCTKEEKTKLEEMSAKFLDAFLIVNSFNGDNLNNQVLQTLQDRYHLKKFPYRMECIDISHLSGSRMSGGLSCIKGGILDKRGYRKYKIQSVIDENNNDYLALREVIERRFLQKEIPDEELPDVFVLDGGKGQLGILKQLYEENMHFRQIYEKIQFISLGKGEARKKTRIWHQSTKHSNATVGELIYFFNEQFEIQEIPLVYDQADRILIKLRDESHRFSNAYRKQQMQQEFKK